MIWAIMPSGRPVNEANKYIEKWREMGYYVAVQGADQETALDICCERFFIRPFSGWAESVNFLCRYVFMTHPKVQWVVATNDDCLPDLYKQADDIGQECSENFRGSYGVMHPTGDRYGGGYIDTAAAHPWIGREWWQETYGGSGPLLAAYKYHYADTELQDVAIMADRYWQRRDLKQEHQHYSRTVGAEMPERTKRWIMHREADERLYLARKAEGFPGALPK